MPTSLLYFLYLPQHKRLLALDELSHATFTSTGNLPTQISFIQMLLFYLCSAKLLSITSTMHLACQIQGSYAEIITWWRAWAAWTIDCHLIYSFSCRQLQWDRLNSSTERQNSHRKVSLSTVSLCIQHKYVACHPPSHCIMYPCGIIYLYITKKMLEEQNKWALKFCRHKCAECVELNTIY